MICDFAVINLKWQIYFEDNTHKDKVNLILRQNVMEKFGILCLEYTKLIKEIVCEDMISGPISLIRTPKSNGNFSASVTVWREWWVGVNITPK